jgi:hypothetical protein
MYATWSSDHSAIDRVLHLRLAIPNGLQLLKGGSQGQFGKGNQNATTVSYNSYNLMHNPR